MADPAWANVVFVGLSATPWTRGLGNHYDDLIISTTTADLIEQGYLSRFVVYAPSEPDLSGVSTVAGDFHEGELAEACDKPSLVGDVIETWIARGENRPTLCYGVNRAHAEHLQQRFLEAGVAAEYIDCFTDRPDRERIFDRFRAGETRVICNVGTLTVGIDLDVRCIIDAKPTKSEMLFVQTIGRGLRTAPGKDRLVILDHAGNHLRLGMVTDIHHERLDDGAPRRRDAESEQRSAPLPKLCEDCKAVLPRQTNRCPECGALREAKSGVDIRDGELVELGSRARPKAVMGVSERRLSTANLFGSLGNGAMRPDGRRTNSARGSASGQTIPYPLRHADVGQPEDKAMAALAPNRLRESARLWLGTAAATRSRGNSPRGRSPCWIRRLPVY